MTTPTSLTWAAAPATGKVGLPTALGKLTVSGPDALQSLIIDGIPQGSTLGDGTNFFLAANGVGSVDVTSWNLANLSITVPSAESFTLTAAATARDSTGVLASATATEAVSVVPLAATLDATTAAGVLTYDDGSANAPAGTPQMAGLLSSYVVRPPWKVAGVDYAVGVPAGMVLADAATISMPGVVVVPSSHFIVITGNNVTLSGYDFSTDGGWGIVIIPGVTDTVIKDCNFLVGSNEIVPIDAIGGVGNLTIVNDTFNGGGFKDGAAWAMLAYSGTGVVTVEYDSFLNTPEDAIDFGSGTMTTIVQYNTFQHLGTSPGAHADAVQYNGSTANNSVIAFNTITSGEEGIQLAAQNGSKLTNTVIDNNVVIAGPLIQGAQGLQVEMSFAIAVQQLPGNTINGVIVDNNYIDSSNAFGPFYTPTGSNITFSGNVDMTSAAQIASPAGTMASDVSSVTVSPAGGTAAAGSTITISLNMDEVVSVGGTPTLSLNNGGTATYQTGSGTNVLTFTYTVGSSDTPIASLAVTAVNLPAGASVTDNFGNRANLSGALVTFTNPVISSAGQARILLWNGLADGVYSNALNWYDDTSGTLTPAAAPPTSVDTVDFFGHSSGITGSGSAGSLTFDSNVGSVFQLGSAAAVNVTGTVTVGQTGPNELLITNGSTLIEGDSAIIANTILGSGSSVQVTGAGSSWQISGALIVGDGGSGSLSISQGGVVTATSAAEATASGGRGSITVSGTGSALNLTGSLTVGNLGSGAVSVLAGGRVTALGLTVGAANASSAGNVDVEGQGSTLHILNGGILNVGVAGGGSGTLTIGGNSTLGFAGTIVEAGHAAFNNNGGVIDADAVQVTSASNAGIGLNLYGLYVDNTGAVQVTGGTGVWNAPMLLTGTSVTNAGSNIHGGSLGQWQLSAGGTLVINANTVDAGQVIVFEDNTDTLVIGQVVTGGMSGQPPTVAAEAENLLQAGGFHAAIWGYQAGDQILFRNLAVVSDRIVNGNTVQLLGAGNTDLGSLTFMTKAGNAPLDATAMAAAATQLASTVIQIDNTTTLVSIGNEYMLKGSGGTGPLLQFAGSPVTTGQFGAFTPIGAVARPGGGYEVALNNPTNGLITVWVTDANGNFTGSPTGGPIPGTMPLLQALELDFNQDLNNDGTVGLKPTQVIQIDNTTTLIAVGNQYVMEGSGGAGPILQFGGSPVTTGQFGAFAPIGAVARPGGGYEVALKNPTNGLVTVWTTDANGNFTGSPSGGPVPGNTALLEELELDFNQDLNNDGTVGLKPTQVIQIDGTTTLIAIANQYVMEGSGGTGPILQFGGSPITTGQFGAFTPIGAVARPGGGYEVALKNPTNGLMTVWVTDANGNFTGSPSGGPIPGTTPLLESLELDFNQDLNNDGTIGLKPTQVIQIDNTTTLIAVGNQYVLEGSGGTGPILQFGSSPVTTGQFGAFAPIGAVARPGGAYEVALKNPTNGLITVWDTDANGNFTGSPTGGAVPGSTPLLEELELDFNQDLNNDGTVGLKPTQVIQIDGTTTLIAIANQYLMEGSAGTGPVLQFGMSPVIAGQFGPGIVPIGAVKTANGYQVAWSLGGNLFVVWNTDSNGNYLGGLTGAVSGVSYALQSLEAGFGQDLNNDGTIGPRLTTIANNGTTALVQVANQYQLQASSGSSPFLQYQGSTATVGGFGAGIVPVGAVKTATGYQVAWTLGGNQFIVWNTDNNGNYANAATGLVPGQSFTLEDLEPLFGEDLNGDGRHPAVLVTSPGPGNVLDLAAQTQATTINLGSNNASASAGLNAPSLAFVGTPNAITLGSAANIIEYLLQPSSGIETIANFVYGQDELNIDLQGAASGLLQAYDTTVGGLPAIAIASSADLLHGVVLLNMTGAANLLASHTSFVGGHALVT